jgi:DNA replication protein DnaC
MTLRVTTAPRCCRRAGPTGAGKSSLACALAQYACRRGHSALYQRVPRLAEELRLRHGNGTFGKWLIQLAKTDVLLLDDWGMTGLDSQTRADLLEIIDDRAASKATIQSPANYPLSTGMPGWETPPLQRPFWTA